MDDDIFEEDEYFYLHLDNLRVRTKDGLELDAIQVDGIPLATLELPSTATVMILGLLQFSNLEKIKIKIAFVTRCLSLTYLEFH